MIIVRESRFGSIAKKYALITLAAVAGLAVNSASAMWRPVHDGPGHYSGGPGMHHVGFRPLPAYRPYSASQREMRPVASPRYPGMRYPLQRTELHHPPVAYPGLRFPARTSGLWPNPPHLHPPVAPRVAAGYPAMGGVYPYLASQFRQLPLFARQYGWKPAVSPWVVGPNRKSARQFAPVRYAQPRMAQQPVRGYTRFRPQSPSFYGSNSRYRHGAPAGFRPMAEVAHPAVTDKRFRPPAPRIDRRQEAYYAARGGVQPKPFYSLPTAYPPRRGVLPAFAHPVVPTFYAGIPGPYIGHRRSMLRPFYWPAPVAAVYPGSYPFYYSRYGYGGYPEVNDYGDDQWLAGDTRLTWQACQGCGD